MFSLLYQYINIYKLNTSWEMKYFKGHLLTIWHRCDNSTVADGVPKHGSRDDAGDFRRSPTVGHVLQLHHVHGGFFRRVHHSHPKLSSQTLRHSRNEWMGSCFFHSHLQVIIGLCCTDASCLILFLWLLARPNFTQRLYKILKFLI